VQLTTGDPDTFHALAARLFGSAFPDVDGIELRGAAAEGSRSTAEPPVVPAR
jgi:hypothetical protein